MKHKHHIIRVQHLVPDSRKGFPDQELNDGVVRESRQLHMAGAHQ